MHALAGLQALRNGWKDENRRFIKQDFVAAQRLDPREYEVQYLEAKTAVGDALQVLPKGELRAAIEQAMDIFDDLEAITEIFNKTSPFSTNVRVADVFPYLKKYNVPYESGVSRATSALTLHQDFVMSYILPVRYARVNRVEVLLAGRAKPVPPPPTYEQMFRVPKQKPPLDRASVKADELKEVARRALEARLRGDRALMGALLDDQFYFYGPEGRRLDKQMYLQKMSADQAAKTFEVKRAELSFSNDTPVLKTVVRYESFLGQSKSFNNTFHFVNRDGRWLIDAWLAD